MNKIFRIASVSSEVAPYSKTGGLADVAKALPKALAHLGHQVIIITPFYGFIKKQDLDLKPVEHKTEINVHNDKCSVSYKVLQFSENLKIYFVICEKLFSQRSKMYNYPDDNFRFLVFDIATLRLLEFLDFQPHIIHCHDWQSGLIPNLLKRHPLKNPSLKKSATLFTIHNLAYQFGRDWWRVPPEKRDDGRGDPMLHLAKIKYINFTKRGIFYADAINTVSERYAEEITTPEFGQGLDKYLRIRKKYLHGIINGIDYAVYNPAFDDKITYKYDWNSLGRKKKNKLVLQKIVGLEKDAEIPLIGVVNRLTEQKGFSLIMETIGVLLQMNLQMVIVGSGQKEYISFFKKIAKEHPKKVGIYTPFTEEMASKVYAGSDIFLLPSRFEPCGISQLISLRYGSIPIVRETGGLSETITDYNPQTRLGNGFVFKNYTREEFLIALTRALENYKYPQAWEYMAWRGMQQSYSWELPGKKYIKLYHIALKNMGHHL